MDNFENDETNYKAAYWGGRPKEQYFGTSNSAPLAMMAAITMMEGDFGMAIELLESEGGEITPAFLHAILLLLKGEARLFGTGEKMGFAIKHLEGKSGAPNKSTYLSTVMRKAQIGGRMMVRHEIDHVKYESAAEDVAKSCGVSVRTVKSAYSYLKEASAKSKK